VLPSRRAGITLTVLLFSAVFAVERRLPAVGPPQLELLPKHFVLHPGEQIHYQVVERATGRPPRSVDYEFSIENPTILRRGEPPSVVEAVTPGRSGVVVRTAVAERRVAIDVAGRAEAPIAAVPHTTIREIVAKDALFVGHANLDGFDHTAVAKPGIDRLVQDAKRSHRLVAYFVSQEYPNWYTADRHPDLAIISEGQEHQIRVEAERVTFAGGSFMFCVLRNVQMTLHGMVTHGARTITFAFPAEAIWVEDLWGPGDKRPYPAPMVLVKTLFARRAGDADAYHTVVVPFLDRLITQYPVGGYPRDAPAPPLLDLLADWRIVVRFGSRFERTYQDRESGKTLFVDFQGV
jgi:hypothetical protein